jgi:dienelactone hydrolase
MKFGFAALCWLSIGLTTASQTARGAGEVGAWNVRELAQAPATQPADEWAHEGVQARFFDGPEFAGKPTRVFAYVGLPTVAAGEKVPGMVLVHGGGGTAFPEWVKLWTARGYAAIALDTGGNVPAKNKAGRERHAWAGPVDGGASLALGDKPPRDQWMYHAVANIMRAHSLLAAQPGVDARRIGLTGISWGGVLTAAVAGVDARFAALVPVYGCGFLDESEVFGAQSATAAGASWMKLWDPRHRLARAKAPMFWVNGTNDRFFQLGSWQRSAGLGAGPALLRVEPRMGHSHPAGWKPVEIGVFVDSVLKGGVPLAVFGEVRREGAAVSASVTAQTAIVAAKLHFTEAVGVASKWLWAEVPAAWEPARGRVQATLPAEARRYFLSARDVRDCTVTSAIGEVAR